MSQSKIKSHSTSMQLKSLDRISNRIEKIAKRNGISQEDFPDLYEHINESVDRDTGSFNQKEFLEWMEKKGRTPKSIKTIIA